MDDRVMLERLDRIIDVIEENNRLAAAILRNLSHRTVGDFNRDFLMEKDKV